MLRPLSLQPTRQLAAKGPTCVSCEVRSSLISCGKASSVSEGRDSPAEPLPRLLCFSFPRLSPRTASSALSHRVPLCCCTPSSILSLSASPLHPVSFFSAVCADVREVARAQTRLLRAFASSRETSLKKGKKTPAGLSGHRADSAETAQAEERWTLGSSPSSTSSLSSDSSASSSASSFLSRSSAARKQAAARVKEVSSKRAEDGEEQPDALPRPPAGATKKAAARVALTESEEACGVEADEEGDSSGGGGAFAEGGCSKETEESATSARGRPKVACVKAAQESRSETVETPERSGDRSSGVSTPRGSSVPSSATALPPLSAALTESQTAAVVPEGFSPEPAVASSVFFEEDDSVYRQFACMRRVREEPRLRTALESFKVASKNATKTRGRAWSVYEGWPPRSRVRVGDEYSKVGPLQRRAFVFNRVDGTGRRREPTLAFCCGNKPVLLLSEAEFEALVKKLPWIKHEMAEFKKLL
ncbi:hypothetical protein TGPRC2_236820 [Toxoplasma gondii TgCatPRC2]|uniref:Uncharacterized protein n=4 Tax=Toxoplasma gondii TaxID=5811 RepID=A0A151HET3_TOXGO|nr:hypothetical protein TGME49_236820 [Toxoplasma gondii ME49]EPT26647.1 hypothetical protein TGME49_236820 [Toxoplasma gondii ME49]KFG31774.1 hypothetical protein TGDOM2_236820 [Toxoplasma gondii GAB2-2007-GAL-DOM2]KYF43057.1 hypothetical protein TGARI_236820 [Toxoplasma gondii ARI]KYK67827.1 hypothetical protein TGPRC2_236820 [Toxoplasma gondii TgCatPRC2]|eukprot:XP_018635784.1 hypothetical protein TGME49_236820 [Toxoplasma gondii ME49]